MATKRDTHREFGIDLGRSSESDSAWQRSPSPAQDRVRVDHAAAAGGCASYSTCLPSCPLLGGHLRPSSSLRRPPPPPARACRERAHSTRPPPRSRERGVSIATPTPPPPPALLATTGVMAERYGRPACVRRGTKLIMRTCSTVGVT